MRAPSYAERRLRAPPRGMGEDGPIFIRGHLADVLSLARANRSSWCSAGAGGAPRWVAEACSDAGVRRGPQREDVALPGDAFEPFDEKYLQIEYSRLQRGRVWLTLHSESIIGIRLNW